MTARQAQNGTSKSKPSWTTSTAADCPSTASQRRRTSVSRRTLRMEWCCCSMLRSDISAILYGLNSRRSRFSVRPPPGAASFELAANQLGHFGHIVQYELELRLAVTVEQLGD